MASSRGKGRGSRRSAKEVKYPSILCVPDTQCKPGVPTSHLEATGRYALDKRPDVIVHLGDLGDFPSLGSYDSAAAKGFDQRDFTADAEAAMEGARMLVQPILDHNAKHRKAKQYHPKLIVLEGNHENRIKRAAADMPWLRGALLGAVNYGLHGWTVVPFLQPVIIYGIAFSHYFCRNARGAVVQTRRGMPSALTQIQREGMSATAGHKQTLDVAILPVGDGTRRRGLICGAFYQHDETYLSPQGENYWRGLLLKHEVRKGDYDLCEVSMSWLLRKWT